MEWGGYMGVYKEFDEWLKSEEGQESLNRYFGKEIKIYKIKAKYSIKEFLNGKIKDICRIICSFNVL